jgi:hypothetical protein
MNNFRAKLADDWLKSSAITKTCEMLRWLFTSDWADLEKLDRQLWFAIEYGFDGFGQCLWEVNCLQGIALGEGSPVDFPEF